MSSILLPARPPTRPARLTSTVLFTAQALTAAAYGIPRYVRNLLQAMSELEPPPPLELFYTGRQPVTEFRQAWPHRWIRVPNRTLHALSVQGPVPIDLGRRYQAVHAPDVMAPRTRSPLIITVHDLVFFRGPQLFPSAYGPEHVGGLRLYQEGARKTIPRAAHLICISENTRRDLLDLFDLDPGRASVIPYGSPQPPPGFRRLEARGPARIVFMGRVEHRKNLPVAVAAVAELRRQGTEAELIVCGDTDGPGATEIRAGCQRLIGEGDWVRWLGRVDAQAVWNEYARAAVLIYPSLYEGFGLPPFEAFSCGVPVIAADISPLRELLGGAAILCDPQAPDQFAQGLGWVLSRPEHARQLAAAGRTRAAEYTWERAAADTVAVYNRI